MTKSITASVGHLGGANHPADVKTVQELLNRVPQGSGGPAPLLAVDCLCGPRTIAAIRRFQARHFGWAIADGRVDPNGPTLRKLNEFDAGGTLRSPLTTMTSLTCPHGGIVSAFPSSRRPADAYGRIPLWTTDHFGISGCPFVRPGGYPSPCMTVRWISPAFELSRWSPGLCLSRTGAPQGPVIIRSA